MELFFKLVWYAILLGLGIVCLVLIAKTYGFLYCFVVYPILCVLFHFIGVILKCIAFIIYINDSSKADDAYYAINEMRDESIEFCAAHRSFLISVLFTSNSSSSNYKSNYGSSDYSYDGHDSYHDVNAEADERVREHRRREDERDNAQAAKVAQENENRRFQKAYNFLHSLYTHEMKTSGTQLQIQKMNDSFSILWNTNRSNAERQRAMHYIAGIFEGKGLINRHYKHSVICEELGI